MNSGGDNGNNDTNVTSETMIMAYKLAFVPSVQMPTVVSTTTPMTDGTTHTYPSGCDDNNDACDWSHMRPVRTCRDRQTNRQTDQRRCSVVSTTTPLYGMPATMIPRSITHNSDDENSNRIISNDSTDEHNNTISDRYVRTCHHYLCLGVTIVIVTITGRFPL